MGALFGAPKQMALPEPVKEPDKKLIAFQTQQRLLSGMTQTVRTSSSGLLSDKPANKNRLLGE